jgi:hypothetical protein
MMLREIDISHLLRLGAPQMVPQARRYALHKFEWLGAHVKNGARGQKVIIQSVYTPEARVGMPELQKMQLCR